MGDQTKAEDRTVDVIRWAFTCAPEHAAAIKEYLTDLGLDVLVYDDSKFLASWDEPDSDVEEVISELWALNGAPFEVTQEDFHRLDLHTLYHVEDEAGEQAA
jgi:hypothetical protein